MRKRGLGFLAMFTLAAGVAACGPKGSCDRRKTGSFECEEILASTIKDMQAAKCKSADSALERGTWTDKAACDRTGAIAGCEDSLSRTWYYPGGKRITKPEHVKQLCSTGKLLDAKGKELKGVSAEKLPDGPASDPTLDQMISSMRAALEANVGAIEKIRVPAAPPGTVRPSAAGKHVATNVTAAIYDGEISGLGDRKADYVKTYPLRDGDDLHACGLAVRAKERQSRSDAEMSRILKWCSQLQYLAVVKTSKLDAPSGVTVSDFHTGVAIGAVFVYELPSGRAIGGYTFRGENSEKVKSNLLESDFRTNYGKAMTTGLQKADPGATFVFEVNATRS